MDRRSFLKGLGAVAGALAGGRLVADIPVVPAAPAIPASVSPPLLSVDEIRKSAFELPSIDWVCSGWGGSTSEADRAREKFFGYSYEDEDDDDY